MNSRASVTYGYPLYFECITFHNTLYTVKSSNNINHINSSKSNLFEFITLQLKMLSWVQFCDFRSRTPQSQPRIGPKCYCWFSFWWKWNDGDCCVSLIRHLNRLYMKSNGCSCVHSQHQMFKLSISLPIHFIYYPAVSAPGNSSMTKIFMRSYL